MGLFDFIEQDNGVRATAHGFCKLATLIVADVSGRRADEAAHGMAFLVFAHVDARHGMLVVEEHFG